jgi:hypothetical protein
MLTHVEAQAQCTNAADGYTETAKTHKVNLDPTINMLREMAKAPDREAMRTIYNRAPQQAKNDTDGSRYWDVLDYIKAPIT